MYSCLDAMTLLDYLDLQKFRSDEIGEVAREVVAKFQGPEAEALDSVLDSLWMICRSPAAAEFVTRAFPAAEIIPFTLLGLIRIPQYSLSVEYETNGRLLVTDMKIITSYNQPPAAGPAPFSRALVACKLPSLHGGRTRATSSSAIRVQRMGQMESAWSVAFICRTIFRSHVPSRHTSSAGCLNARVGEAKSL